MIVIKRDGRKVEFNKDKIINALESAFMEVDSEISEETKNKIEVIANSIENKGATLTVEQIQDFIEEKLMASNRKDVAKEYILYRAERTRQRNLKSKLMKDINEKLSASNIQNQNANVDETSFGGRIGEANDVLLKEIALNEYVSDMARENHLNNEIYIHDLNSYVVGSHNCLSIPFDDLLAKGFNTRQTDVRPASSISTALQLVAVIFQLQSLQQFGGVSATHLDWTLVPYLRLSYYKHYNEVMDILPFHRASNYNKEDVKHISIDDKTIYKNRYGRRKALRLTKKELDQAIEGLYHNLNY